MISVAKLKKLKGKIPMSRKLLPGVLVIMLAGIVFPFITADPVSHPEDKAKVTILTNSELVSNGNMLSAEDYADAALPSWLNKIRILIHTKMLIQRDLLQERWTLLLLTTELKWESDL